MPKRIGIDLGGSWIRVGVFNTETDKIERIERHPSPASWERFVDVLTRYNDPAVEGYGIAAAATIEDHATVVKAPNLHWLDGRNVRRDLESHLGKQVIVANDMEAAAEGEMARGVLKSFRWAIFDTISTGWGGNLILDGKRVDGEPGHANVRFDLAFPCGCGKFGCNEALYSGSALTRRILQIFEVRHATSPPGADLWQFFYHEAATGTAWASALLDEWAEGVGRAWANVLNRVRPMQAIVYMGTTAETMLAQPRVQQRLRSTLEQICMFPEHRRHDFPVVKATEENRGIYGALIVYSQVM
jgi:predicted NBD/HSP70 family sugar kinase